jgi:hypothetical protein
LETQRLFYCLHYHGLCLTDRLRGEALTLQRGHGLAGLYRQSRVSAGR